MPSKPDGNYAARLIEVLEQDMLRLERDVAWSPIVIWEAEELIRQAESLKIPREQSKSMVKVAERGLAAVREARARERSMSGGSMRVA